ncbi:helix-turn-helix domain-containing protein [Rheinheimera marina]|uniref:Helix-turn-helix domain-containing protein n=1 Tax=Rheinheimera marina TaxID=1774958 RepID=A0ABV9JHF9_9GAMM
MIRYHLRRCIGNYESKTGAPLQIAELAERTGVHRATLSKMLNRPRCNITTDVINRLCVFFNVSVDELIEYVPDHLVD